MRTIRILLIAAMIVSLSTSAWAQASPSATNEESGTTYNEVIGPNGQRQRIKVRILKGPPPWRVGAIKLLVPGVGWAAAGARLIWTTDNGAHWKDITPYHRRDEILGRVFFLNRSRAWITIDEDKAVSNESPHYAVASTIDSGSSWAQRHFTLRPKDFGISQGPLRGGAGEIAFADPLHGWMSVGFSRETMNSSQSFLLTTSDGGRNWRRLPDPPELVDPEMFLISPSKGWLYGPFYGQGLFLTNDGAHSWQEVAPKVAGIEINNVSALPTFTDSNHGFLPVSGTTPQGSIWKFALGLLATSDGGQTWKLDRAVVNMDEASLNRFRNSTVAGSQWIFASSFNHMPELTKLDAGMRFDASPKADPAYGKYNAARQISFVNAKEGWVVIGDGQILSTIDGGKTWTDITPGPKSQFLQSPAP
jgi:photosystem II stability/assembly factor-like uncharacterized protein